MLRAGIAEVDFTPPPGLPLMGNIRDSYEATGVHDPLTAKALVLEDGAGSVAALVSLDLCMIDRDQVGFMRDHIAQHTSVPRESILIAATHTHAGPATVPLYICPTAHEDSIREFLTVAADSVIQACDHMRPAELRVGYSREPRVSFNRRLLASDGKTVMNWAATNPGVIRKALGPTDPRVCVVTVVQEGKASAALVNFGLHPAILDYGNSLYSADYPGYLAEGLTRTIGADLITLFFNGCCGNVNHIDFADPDSPRRGYAMTQRIGYMLAAAAAEAIRNSRPIRAEPITVSRRAVDLQRLEIDDATYRWSLEAIEGMKTHPPTGSADGLPREYSAPVWVEMHDRQHLDDQVEVMAIALGELGIVGYPEEMFCELGLATLEGSPFNHTLAIELANDAVGYIPTREAFDQGGYEATPGSTRYRSGGGERLVAAALEQLSQLWRE